MNQLSLALFGAATLCSSLALAAENWPQFRGPGGDGHSDSRGLPLTWSETQHVKWKTPIHDKGWSSPVIWGDQVWLTTATDDGKHLFALALDKNSGQVTRDLKLFDAEQPELWKQYNSYASPTPVIEEGRVYVTFGGAGTACLDTRTGKLLWERRDLACNHYRGAGSSPILFRDLLLMNFDGSDTQFVIALNKNTGATVWKVNRSIDYKDLGPDGKPQTEGDFRKAFATPQVAEFGGRPVLLSSGAKAHYGYEPLTGKELWRVEERSCHSCANRPVVGHGMYFLSTGFSRAVLLAIQPPSALTATPCVVDASDSDAAAGPLKVAWKITKGVPNKPSLLLVNDLLFMVNDGGVAMCVEAKTGKEVWMDRIEAGKFSASPLYADDRIYFFGEEGRTTVIAADRQFKKLAENKLEGGVMASPAVSGKALFLRSQKHLYRIENMESAKAE